MIILHHLYISLSKLGKTCFFNLGVKGENQSRVKPDREMNPQTKLVGNFESNHHDENTIN